MKGSGGIQMKLNSRASKRWQFGLDSKILSAYGYVLSAKYLFICEGDCCKYGTHDH